ncbi:MAG: ABC transporter ATP-binding protein [Planctomycetota bacterium]
MSRIDETEREESFARGIDLALWRRLFRYALRYRRTVILFALAGATVAAADVCFPLVTRRVIDEAAQHGAGARLLECGLVYAGLLLLLCGGVFSFIRLGGTIRTCVSHDIRADGFASLQRLSFAYYDRRPVGWLMARMTADCDRLSQIMAWGVLDTVWGLTLMAGITAAMLALDARLALAVVAVVPVLAAASVFFQKRILASSRVVRRTNSRLTAAYNEGIMGVRTTKVFSREQESLREFQSLSGEMFSASVRNQVQSALYLPVVLTIGSLATSLALAAGGFQVSGGAISIGTLIAFLSYSRSFFEPVQELAYWFAELQMAQAGAERIMGLVAEVPEIQDSSAVRAAIAAHRAAPPRPGLAEDGLPDEIARIEFRDVSFAYRDGPPVLQHFDLTVRAGQTIALCGPTGGGKSTIAGLLCRFYEPTAGEIRIDGRDYRTRSLHWLQSNLGIVLQTPHLFSGTILENIRYGNLAATDDEVIAAARLAGAHDFVAALEDGYATQAGEGGSRLSTGQKQLVSFARAILARPRLLVMDEATSSIDTETEHRLQAGLAHVLAGRTSFVIAHRLSTIRAADRILVIDGGRIVEDGPHAALMAKRGRYFALYTQQSLRESGRTAGAWGPPVAVRPRG